MDIKPTPTMVKVPPEMSDAPRAPNNLVLVPPEPQLGELEKLEAAPAPVGASIAKIATAIANVMTRVGVVAKDGVNQFHNYKYAKMEDVLRRITPLIGAEGLVIMQTEIGRADVDNGRAVAVKYAFTICHTSGEIWPERLLQTGLSRCRDSKGGFDDKCFNKCHTAARKYFILALFQVPTGVDEDADEDRPPTVGKNGWPQGDLQQAGDYEDGEPEGKSKPKQENKYTRTLNAAITHADRARAMQDELRQCTSAVDLLALGDELKERQNYKNLPDMLKQYIWKTQAKCLDRLRSEVVHDTDDLDPRPATEDDFDHEAEEAKSISQRAIEGRLNNG